MWLNMTFKVALTHLPVIFGHSLEPFTMKPRLPESPESDVSDEPGKRDKLQDDVEFSVNQPLQLQLPQNTVDLLRDFAETKSTTETSPILAQVSSQSTQNDPLTMSSTAKSGKQPSSNPPDVTSSKDIFESLEPLRNSETDILQEHADDDSRDLSIPQSTNSAEKVETLTQNTNTALPEVLSASQSGVPSPSSKTSSGLEDVIPSSNTSPTETQQSKTTLTSTDKTKDDDFDDLESPKVSPTQRKLSESPIPAFEASNNDAKEFNNLTPAADDDEFDDFAAPKVAQTTDDDDFDDFAAPGNVQAEDDDFGDFGHADIESPPPAPPASVLVTEPEPSLPSIKLAHALVSMKFE
jgi:hypothetical protein